MITIVHTVTEQTPFAVVSKDVPLAYLGLAPAFLPERVVRICASCPDRAEAEALAASEGCDTTHTYCPSCYAAEMAALNKRFPVSNQ